MAGRLPGIPIELIDHDGRTEGSEAQGTLWIRLRYSQTTWTPRAILHHFISQDG